MDFVVDCVVSKDCCEDYVFQLGFLFHVGFDCMGEVEVGDCVGVEDQEILWNDVSKLYFSHYVPKTT